MKHVINALGSEMNIVPNLNAHLPEVDLFTIRPTGSFLHIRVSGQTSHTFIVLSDGTIESHYFSLAQAFYKKQP